MKETINQIKNSTESITNKIEHLEDRTSDTEEKIFNLENKVDQTEKMVRNHEQNLHIIMGHHEEAKFKNYWD